LKRLYLLPLFLLALTIIPIHCTEDEWGFRSGYQGPDIRFVAVRWKDYVYTASNRGPNPNYELSEEDAGYILLNRGGSFFVDEDTKASACQFGDRLNWDPDMDDNGLPNIMGSSDIISIDVDDIEEITRWRLPDKKRKSTIRQVKNDTGTYNVTTNYYIDIILLRVPCDYNLNFYLSAAHMEAYPDKYTHHMNVEVMMEIDAGSPIYFKENPVGAPICAPIYIVCDDHPTWGHYDAKTGEEIGYGSQTAKLQSIFPGAKGESLGVWRDIAGLKGFTEQQVLKYKGYELDPRIFWMKYYIRVCLDIFMPYSEWGPWHCDWYEKLPSVSIPLKMDLLVFGQLQVIMETAEKVELERHVPQEKDTPDLIPDFPELPKLNVIRDDLILGIRLFIITGIIGVILLVANKLRMKENVKYVIEREKTVNRENKET